MKKLIFILSMLLFAFISDAQITFQKIISGTNWNVGRSVKQTINGGYIVAGTISLGMCFVLNAYDDQKKVMKVSASLSCQSGIINSCD